MKLTFGDNTDGDVLQTLFGRMMDLAYVLSLTTADGAYELCDVVMLSVGTTTAGMLALRFRVFDELLNRPVGDPFLVELDNIAELEIH